MIIEYVKPAAKIVLLALEQLITALNVDRHYTSVDPFVWQSAPHQTGEIMLRGLAITPALITMSSVILPTKEFVKTVTQTVKLALEPQPLVQAVAHHCTFRDLLV